jgi:aminoglycoside phosphotransferase (APT) family kinase protein
VFDATWVTVLQALADTDVPTPTLRWFDLDGTRLGRPSPVMDLAPGGPATCSPDSASTRG